MQYRSLATLVLERAEEFGSRRVFIHKRLNRWEEVSWRTFGKDIIAAAKGLSTLGFKPGDRLAILADNGPAWPTIDLACLYLGGVDVPLYLTSHSKDLTYILNDSGATVLAVAGDDQREKLTKIAADIPMIILPSICAFTLSGLTAIPQSTTQSTRCTFNFPRFETDTSATCATTVTSSSRGNQSLIAIPRP